MYDTFYVFCVKFLICLSLCWLLPRPPLAPLLLRGAAFTHMFPVLSLGFLI